MKQIGIVFILLLLGFNNSMAQQTLTPELLWKIGRVGLDDVSPDGQWAVYGVQRYDVAENKGTRGLFLVNISTGESRALTDGQTSDREATFHPSGQMVLFLRGGKLQQVPVNGTATVTKVSDLSLNGFRLSPDGKRILFIQDTRLGQAPVDVHPDLPKTTGRVFDQLMYRHWMSWHEQQYSHVWYANFENGQITGKSIDIMADERFHCPLQPGGGIEQVTWSPDGRFIAYTCRKLNGTAEAQSTNSDIYVYELKTGRTLNFSSDLGGYDQDPIFSPDGRYLAWTSMATPGYEADNTRLMVLDVASGQRTELTAGWNWECNHPQWAADSKSLYFLSSNDFTYQLHQIDRETRKINALTKGRHDYSSLKVAGNMLVALRTQLDAPAEIYAIEPASGSARRLTTATQIPWDGLAKAQVQRRSVRTTDGKDMNVWVVLPPNFDAKKRYPAILLCQGGPQSAVSQNFSYRWNTQLMAAKGYVVVYPCRRGMPGGPEGRAWNAAISRDWGGQAMRDLLSAIDDVKKEPWIDANRLAAVGASFGGYSVYWLAGNHDKRFKAFISHCGMFNTESWWGTTEEMWFAKHDLGDGYWVNPKDPAWTTFNPIRYADKWDTPMLVIHNELDFRVPFSEGMQAFQAAQMRGVPSRFLSFPDEGHWMTKPQNSLHWQREFFGWLDQWLK
jgi:dipeptidyl aminopeptidase/acylaminoacyl peptidase